MTLTQLRTFLAVVDTGSVRAAAERLLVAQPSVSAALSALERELGVTLAARHGRGLRITAAGAAFAAAARQSLGLLDQGVRTARGLEAPGHGQVQLAAVTTAAERLLLPVIARFRTEHPEAGVTVQVGNRTTVWESLRHFEADLVVAGRPPAGVPAVVLATAGNRLVLVGPADPASLGGRSGPPVGLGEQTWLLREEGSGTREATEELIEELGIRPPRMILGSNGAIVEGVAEGLGVALISLHAVGPTLAGGSIAPVACPGTPIDRPFHLVAHEGQPLSPTAGLLAASMVGGGGGFELTEKGRLVLGRQAGR